MRVVISAVVVDDNGMKVPIELDLAVGSCSIMGRTVHFGISDGDYSVEIARGEFEAPPGFKPYPNWQDPVLPSSTEPKEK